MIRILLLFLLLLRPGPASPQVITNTGVERDMQAECSIRLNYENDFFTATDYYHTQGALIEFLHPQLRHFLLLWPTLKPAGWYNRLGAGLEQNGYTPLDYSQKDIQYGDRPYAGTLAINLFSIAADTLKGRRLITMLSAGLIGPAAGAGDIQTMVHEITPNTLPMGWHNQVANDLLLNYCIRYEQQLLERRHLNLSAGAAVWLGTLSNKAGPAVTLMLGFPGRPFGAPGTRRFRCYVYDRPELCAVLYDATMQGGWFSSSPYTLDASAIRRLVFRNNWGICLQLGALYLEYYQSFMTQEFRGGRDMRNGGIQLGFRF